MSLVPFCCCVGLCSDNIGVSDAVDRGAGDLGNNATISYSPSLMRSGNELGFEGGTFLGNSVMCESDTNFFIPFLDDSDESYLGGIAGGGFFLFRFWAFSTSLSGSIIFTFWTFSPFFSGSFSNTTVE